MSMTSFRPARRVFACAALSSAYPPSCPALTRSSSRPERTSCTPDACDGRLRLRPPCGHDPDARRGEAAHRRPRPEGRVARTDPADAHTYDADALTTHLNSPHLGPRLYGYDNATDVIVDGGYIRVVQDVRGKYHSEGDYVMNRPLRGPLNPLTSITPRTLMTRSTGW